MYIHSYFRAPLVVFDPCACFIQCLRVFLSAVQNEVFLLFVFGKSTFLFLANSSICFVGQLHLSFVSI